MFIELSFHSFWTQTLINDPTVCQLSYFMKASREMHLSLNPDSNLVVGKLWATQITPLKPHFYRYKMGIMTSASQHCFEDHGERVYNIQHSPRHPGGAQCTVIKFERRALLINLYSKCAPSAMFGLYHLVVKGLSECRTLYFQT